MTLKHDLGTFEGFNFRDQAALDRNLTADEVLDWDHDGAGELEPVPTKPQQQLVQGGKH